MAHQLLEGKKGVVFGVANKRSIAWAIAKACSDAGARLAFAYQGEKLRPRVEDLVQTLPGESPLYSCDVTNDADVDAVGESLKRDFGTVDFLVHSIAFAERSDLERIAEGWRAWARDAEAFFMFMHVEGMGSAPS